MPPNILPFSERSNPAQLSETSSALFRSNLDLLHSNDQNTLHYFGLNRTELLERVGGAFDTLPSSDSEHPSVLHYARNLADLQNHAGNLNAIPDESPFFWFEHRFHLYFAARFIQHPRYPDAAKALEASNVLDGLRRYIGNTVRRLSEPTLVHALNHQILAEPAFTLARFSECLKTPATISDLASEYPVLFNLLFETLEDIADYLIVVACHFIADREALRATFAGSIEKIEAIHLGLGDPHGRQQTVCEVTSAGCSIIYKPRPNREMGFYNEALSLLQQRTGGDWFYSYSPKLLTAKDHCWVEKISHLACESHTQRILFYRRLGAQIALIHALNGIDFHFENIIAHGTSPVMIDLECLFTAPLGTVLNTTPVEATLAKAQQMVRESIFSTGFVPYAHHALNDVSGLSAQSQLTITRQTLVPENGFYQLRKSTAHCQAPLQHQPFVTPSDVKPYLPALLEGFDFAYDAICSHRDALLEHLERNAAHLTTRILVKNTQRYMDFIALGLHPRFMQNQLDRELLISTLWPGASENVLQRSAFWAEVEDLQRLAIPRFELAINSRALGTAVRAEPGPILEQSPLQNCRQKLQSLCPAGKKLQRAVFDKCLNPGSASSCPLNAAHSNHPAAPLDAAQALQAAENTAARIEALMIVGEDRGIRWLAFKNHTITQKKYLTVMNNDLYSGIPGIGLFFLGLYRVTTNAHYLQRTDQILDSLARTQDTFAVNSAPGGYQGLAGHIYLLWHRKILAPTERYDRQLETLIGRLCELPTDTLDIDFIAGNSGTLALLSELHTCAPEQRLATAIGQRVEQIARTLHQDTDGRLQNHDGSVVLTGLSHGLSGAILALCKAHDATRDNRALPLIEGFINAENALKEQGYWRDLRECSQSPHASKWCHGDAGILLARQAVLQSFKGHLPQHLADAVNEDIACCLRNLLASGLSDGYTLCHGDFGNLMCLETLYRIRGDEDAIDAIRRRRAATLSDYLGDIPAQSEHYPELGLMTGISGIGYALLKHMDPSLPDVLSLALSRPRGSQR
ncbi:TPA: type 2 lanthipeptide synthetase LanM [Pseudomonas putida]